MSVLKKGETLYCIGPKGIKRVMILEASEAEFTYLDGSEKKNASYSLIGSKFFFDEYSLRKHYNFHSDNREDDLAELIDRPEFEFMRESSSFF